MPKRTDLRHVMVIGSGPIVIGQACEFDYSGTQACRVLRAEGLRVSLVNSNPATIMTDPEFADATYVEPITPEFVELVIARERPDAILPTLGGQTALNTAVALHENGVLEKYGVELIGANIDAIRKGEDRQLFKDIVAKAGGETPRSRVCHSMDEVHATVAELGLPVVIRPSFTMGGLGSGMAHNDADLDRLAGGGLAASPVHEVLIEESVLGWKEYELELMRDKHDNVVVVCSIENVDPMGVHTGDSVTVAPAMTLTDREYQKLRDLGIAVLREVGVDTGGCNIQFAINPADGRLVVIEMNPRVSRSCALASKATGFPIAKIAAKLAIGYTLDEIPNDITLQDPGRVRAGAGLRGGEDPAVRVREVPGRRRRADHHDEVRRRGDEPGPQLRRGAQQGDALDGDQGRRLLDGAVRSTTAEEALAAMRDPARRAALHRGGGAAAGRERRAGARGQRRHRPVVPGRDRRAGRAAAADPRRAGAGRGAAAPGQALRALRPAARRAAPRAGRRGRRPDRCGTGWACGRSTRPSTPAPPSSPRTRRTTTPRTTRRPRSRRRTGPRC